MRKPIATIGVLGILLALATPRQTTESPQLQPAASAVRAGGSQPGPTPTRTPAPSGRSQTPIADVENPETWFNDPIGHMAYVYRTSLGLENETGRNIAIAFVDITGLIGLDTKGYQVMDVNGLKTSDPALYRELGLANRPGVEKFAIVPAVNDASANDAKGLHSEQKIILQDAAYLSPYDGGYSITPERMFAFYSDRSPCAATCAPTVVPGTADVLYATVNNDTYAQQTQNLSSKDMGILLGTARVQARASKAEFNEEVAARKALNEERNAADVERQKIVSEIENGYEHSLNRRGMFATSAAESQSNVQSPSQPCDGQSLVDQSGPCPSASASANSAASSNASNSSLTQVLTEPNVASPGGIDFSRIQLDYLSDPGDGSGLQYAFGAPTSLSGGGSAAGALNAAGLASAAFFVWLELDPSADWVNLNPTEPDRIVDAQMGRTDVGRIMLQADLALKKDVGTLIYPNSALGKSFWSELEGGCFASRVWVVPSPAQVYTTGDEFYILKAPLNVKMEADYLQLPKGQTAAVSCPKQDAVTQAHNEALYRSLVLPKLVSMVNTDPSFADLRTIYRSRVAAEWYRNLSESKHTTYAGLIDQDNISQWTTTTGWNPEQTFQQYVTSYTKGEWHVTSTVNKGDYTYEYDYTYGGVDLTSVPIQQVSSATFAAADPSLAQDVSQSLTAPTTADSGTVIFGSPTPLQAEKAALAAQDSTARADGSPLGTTLLRWLPLLALILLPSTPLLPLAAVGIWGRERRLRKTSEARKSSQGSNPPEGPKGPHGPTWA
jgi:hypothetical protein